MTIQSQTLVPTPNENTVSRYYIKRGKIKPQELQKQKALILDSGTLINLSMNGLLYILEELKKISKVKFLITQQVKYETIDRPIDIPRFELGALRIETLLVERVIELPESLNISNEEVKSETNNLLSIANHTVQSRGKWINIVSDAEMSCLALSLLLKKRNIENIIAIDERTTRILAERPSNLEELMSKRLHQLVLLESKNFSAFKDFKFLRSTELVYVAYRKGVLKVQGDRALEATLFATKFKGSSVSYDEINVLKKL